MSNFRTKSFVKKYKLRLQKKFTEFVTESENVSSRLHEEISKIKDQAKAVQEDDTESFFGAYEKAIEDIEKCSEKLFLISNILCSDEFDESGDILHEEKELSEKNKLFPNAECEVKEPVIQKAKSYLCEVNIVAADSKSSVEKLIDDDESEGSLTAVKQLIDDNTQGFSTSIKRLNNETQGSSLSVNKQFSGCNDLKTLNAKQVIEPCFEERNLIPNVQKVNNTSLVVDTSASEDSFFNSVSSNSGKSSQSCLAEYADAKNTSKECEKQECDMPKASYYDKANAMLCSVIENSEEQCETIKDISDEEIASPNVQVGSYIRANLTEFQSPSEFWMQLWDSEDSGIQFPHLKCTAKLDVSDVKKGRYCLALLKGKGVKENAYQRARVMNLFGSGENVTVVLFYIDYGCKRLLDACELHVMPSSYFAQPARAIRCYLNGVVNRDFMWSEKANTEFLNNMAYDPRVFVASEMDGRYAVDFIIPTVDNDEMYLSEYLCYQELATPVVSDSEVPLAPACNVDCANAEQKVISETESSGSSEYIDLSSLKFQNTSENTDIKSSDASSYFETNFNNEPVNFKGKQLSGDTEFEFDEPQAYEKSSVGIEKCNSSYSSADTTRYCRNSSPSYEPSSIPNDAILKERQEFDWDVQIPPPQLTYIKDNLMLVIASAIYSPYEFYVNSASENALDLDSVREQMNSFYEQRKDWKGLKIKAENLKIGTFCCIQRSEDNWWYRAQIIGIAAQSDDQPKALIQFVDYGDSSWVDFTKLRPLTKMFAKYPAFAILCSLAYVIPKGSNGEGDAQWDKYSIDKFKEFVGYDKCFTAQIVANKQLLDGRTILDVLLWDSSESGERLVNDMMISEELADALPEIMMKKEDFSDQHDVMDELDEWNPIAEDYHRIENSYGVNMNDVEIATVGYKAKDESYICKYYARYGHCYRSNCHYEHIIPDFGGTTVDQEEVNCLENNNNRVVLPPLNSRVLGQVSCVVSPSHFYLVFPYSLTPISDIDNLGLPKKGPHTEFEALARALNTYYNNAPFREVTTMALALGTIVVAKSNVTALWYRALVKEVVDVDKPVKVFFVDIGSTEWINRKNIQEIKKEFLFTPFQATECFLTNVKPNDYDGGVWTTKAKVFFQKLVHRKTLVVDVDKQIGNVLHVTLTLTEHDGLVRLNELLVAEGFAQYVSRELAINYDAIKLISQENGTCDMSSCHQPG